VLPIVEAGALHLTFVQRKAEWLDEMQGGAGGQARTPSIPGIPVDLWMHEHDVCGHSCLLIELRVTRAPALLVACG